MKLSKMKLKWARRLLGAKYFVVVTDKSSIIAIDGVDPSTVTDTVVLASQAAELHMFYDALGDLIDEYEAALVRLSGGSDEATINRKQGKQATQESSKGKVRDGKTPVRTNANKA